MAVRPEMRRLLFSIGNLAHDDTNTSVLDSAIKRETSLPDFELNKVLDELQSSGLIEILPKPTGVNFKLVNITPKGLEELRSDDATN